LPDIASTIVQTIGAGDIELRQTVESGVVSLDNFDVTLELKSEAGLLNSAPFKVS